MDNFRLSDQSSSATSATLAFMGKSALQQVYEYYSAARIRAGRRKSTWNLLLIPPGVFGWLGTWYLQFRIVWAFHQRIYPQHSFHNFWQAGISFESFVLSFLMLFGPFFGALCMGLILANCVVWLIIPARRKLSEESIGYPGTGFRDSNVRLIRLTAYVLPVGLVVALVAASLLKSLR